LRIGAEARREGRQATNERTTNERTNEGMKEYEGPGGGEEGRGEERTND